MTNKPLTAPRAAFLTLALLAVTLLSVHAVCDQWFIHLANGAPAAHATALHHDTDPAGQCCVSARDSNLVAPLQATPGGTQSLPEPGPAVLVAVVAVRALLATPSYWLRGPPRRQQSFYVRSARILR